MRGQALLLNLVIVVSYLLLFRAARRHPGSETLRVIRDLLPLALMLAAYKQMGWFAPASHDFALERSWIEWDRLVLYGWGFKAAVESLGQMLPSLLEISYSLVYALPLFCVFSLYVTGRRRDVDVLLTVYLLGLFLSYIQFPFWPSEPPRTVFPGQDLPAITTVFRRFNLALLGSQGIHTSVFPSAHVSGAFAAVFALFHLFPGRPKLPLGVLTYASLVAAATVYGRYHYAVDAAAGMVVAVFAFGLGKALLARCGGLSTAPAPCRDAVNA
jgi:membrane-associated phospholipid phosphatase